MGSQQKTQTKRTIDVVGEHLKLAWQEGVKEKVGPRLLRSQ